LGVLGVPLKRPKKGCFLGLLGTLWRDSEGVRRESDRVLRRVGRGLKEKKEDRRVVRADKGLS